MSKEKGQVTDMNGSQTHSQMVSNTCKVMAQDRGALYLKLFCVIKLFVCIAFVNFPNCVLGFLAYVCAGLAPIIANRPGMSSRVSRGTIVLASQLCGPQPKTGTRVLHALHG